MARSEPSKGKILRLEMENFKSYKGHQLIGPFKDFTAIIGPNGSGKSNLMDAISFVLGVRTRQLRGSQLKDLIYCSDDPEKEERDRTAFVRLVYQLPIKGEINFIRTIRSNGGSVYKIDGIPVASDAYYKRLKSLGILVKARNFLVFQGDVESITSKNSKELTGLLEQISGSDEFKKEYEELEAKKGSAEEKLALLYQEKKTIAAKKELKKAQKEEAEKHLRLQEELKALKRKHFLWQLYSIDNGIKEATEDVAAEKSKLKDVQGELEMFKLGVREREVEQTKYLIKIAQREEKISERRSELTLEQPKLLKFEVKIARINSKIESNQKEVERKKKEKGKHSKEIEQMQESINELTKKMETLNEKSQDSSGKLPEPDSQLQNYFRLKEEADMETIKERDEKEVLDRQQHTDLEALRNLEENCKQLTNRETDLGEQIKRLKSRQKEIEDSSSKYENQTTLLKKRLQELQDDRKAHEKLKTVESLKKQFQGVRGRMTDLCSNMEKYNLAVIVAMGSFMDAVVVDNVNTGKDCIKHLKEQRLPPMTFIPLQSINIKPVFEKKLDGTAKLVSGVIQCDPELERAVRFAVGNTVVCDELEEAKLLSSTGEKVVTVDGTLLTNSGTMTRGTSGEMEAKSNKSDDKEIEELKKNKKEDELQLQKIGSIREMMEPEISGKISGLEEKIQDAEIKKEMLNSEFVQQKSIKDKLPQLEEEKRNILEEIGRRNGDLTESQNKVDNTKREIKKLEEKINGVVDVIFKNFSQSVGVANIREYEENQLKDAKNEAEKRLNLSNQLAKLKSQLKYEQNQGVGLRIQKLESSISTLETDLENLKKEESKLMELTKNATNEINSWEKEMRECKQKLEGYKKEILDLEKQASEATTKITELNRQILSKETQIKQLKSQKQDIAEKCKLEDIIRVVSDAMEEDGPDGLQFDFSELGRASLEKLKSSACDKMVAEFSGKIESKTSEIERTAPNLGALDQYEAIQEREKKVSEEYEAAHKEGKQVEAAYNTVRLKREELFWEAFKHISDNIDKIYKQLTKSDEHPLGGSAYLILENEIDPFLHGIRYSTMPPTKRFRDMEQLSGGEKTVAALALLFSFQSYKPSPFVILDEVDAALDNVNVAKVADFIRSKSSQAARKNLEDGGNGFQSIVISLKDSFYEADALIGVFKDNENSGSRTLSFDLRDKE